MELIGGLIIALCALAIVSVISLAVWAKLNPSERYRAETDLDLEWHHAIR